MTDAQKIEKIVSILKTAKADPTRDEYAEYYLDAIEDVIRRDNYEHREGYAGSDKKMG